MGKLTKARLRIVIVHSDAGIYLGHAMGLGFFSLLDSAGQPAATTFDNEEQAREHVAAWEGDRDHSSYRYVVVDTRGLRFADVMALTAARLGREAAPLLANEVILRTETLQ